jgi:magnesium chelatase subunit I
LVYEGEQEGAEEVAQLLIDQAVLAEFEKRFPKISKLEKAGTKTPYSDIVKWFETNDLELNYTENDEDFNASLQKIEPLQKLIQEYCGKLDKEEQLFYSEIVIWTLSIKNKVDKLKSDSAFSFDSNGYN